MNRFEKESSFIDSFILYSKLFFFLMAAIISQDLLDLLTSNLLRTFSTHIIIHYRR